MGPLCIKNILSPIIYSFDSDARGRKLLRHETHIYAPLSCTNADRYRRLYGLITAAVNSELLDDKFHVIS